LRLASPQQTVIDENARELIADSFMEQGRRNARVDAAAQAENDLLSANLRLDVFDRLLDVVAHRPVLAAAADIVDKIGQDLAPVWRVRYFRVELQAEHPCVQIFDCR